MRAIWHCCFTPPLAGCLAVTGQLGITIAQAARMLVAVVTGSNKMADLAAYIPQYLAKSLAVVQVHL